MFIGASLVQQAATSSEYAGQNFSWGQSTVSYEVHIYSPDLLNLQLYHTDLCLSFSRYECGTCFRASYSKLV